MRYAVAALIGALLNCIVTGVQMAKHPVGPSGYPIQGYLVAAVIGALVYGTILYFVFLLVRIGG